MNKISNNMYGRIEVVEPPLVTHDLPPVKDAFIRKQAAHLNFGNMTSIAFGNLSEDQYQSYLGFNIQSVPSGKDLDRATLVFTLASESEKLFDLEIYEVQDKEWSEYAVKWDYKPDVIGEFIKSFKVYPGLGEVEVDITDYVTDWYSDSAKESRSFLVLPKEVSISDSVLSFGSRESVSSPLLQISYYDIPPNAGVAHIGASAIIKVNTSDDLSASVDIDSQFVAADLPVQALFEAKNFGTEIPASTTITLKDISEFPAYARFEKKEKDTEIDVFSYVREYGFLDIDTTASFENKHKSNELTSTATVKVFDGSELESELIFEEKQRTGDLDASVTLFMPETYDLDISLTFPKKNESSDVDATVGIKASGVEDLDASLNFEAKHKDINLDAVYDLRAYGESALDSTATFEAKKHNTELDADLMIIVSDKAELDASVTIMENKSHSDLDVTAILGKKSFETSIDADVMIRVGWAEELESSATIAYKADTEIDATVSIVEDDDGSYGFIL